MIPHSFQPSFFSNTGSVFPEFLMFFLQIFGSLARMEMEVSPRILGLLPSMETFPQGILCFRGQTHPTEALLHSSRLKRMLGINDGNASRFFLSPDPMLFRRQLFGERLAKDRLKPSGELRLFRGGPGWLPGGTRQRKGSSFFGEGFPCKKEKGKTERPV